MAFTKHRRAAPRDVFGQNAGHRRHPSPLGGYRTLAHEGRSAAGFVAFMAWGGTLSTSPSRNSGSFKTRAGSYVKGAGGRFVGSR